MPGGNIDNMVLSLTINSFRAINHPDLCENFSTGHGNVLKDFGVTKVTSAEKVWHDNPNSYVISVQMDNQEEFVAGARVDVYGGSYPLPIEDAIGVIDKSIYPLVQSYADAKTGEVCGLWTSKQCAGNGIAFMMIKSSVVLAKLLNLGSVFALCSPFTVSMFSKLGFEVVKSLGKDGTFYYPKLDLIATAMILKDLGQLTNIPEDNRDIILNLINHPTQQSIENGTKGQIKIDYNLQVES